MHHSNIHDISSQGSNNQFMTGQMSMFSGMQKNNQISEQEKDKIFAFMKNIVSNPLLREQMEKHFTQKDNITNINNNKSAFTVKNNQSLSISRFEQEIRPQPKSYVIQPSQQKIPEPLRDTIQGVNFKKTHPSTMHKKGKDVLSNYNSNNSKNSDQQKQQNTVNKSQQIQPATIKNTKPSFEDMPIKSNYIINIQNSQYAIGNQAPPALYPDQQKFNTNNNKKPLNNKKQTDDKNVIKNQYNTNKYVQLEQRPINGSKKQFKDLLKQKFEQTPFDSYINLNHSQQMNENKSNNYNYNYNDDQQKKYYNNNNNNNNDQNQDQQQNNNKPKRQFLKRGTRQYLSSAKDKVVKKNKKQNNNDMNNSRLDKQDRDKTPKRQVSQNRILSKRNNNQNNNDKYVQVFKNSKYQNQNKEQEQYEQTNNRRNITPRNQRLNHQKDKSPALPPKNNKLIQPVVNQNTSLNSSKNTQQRKKDMKNVFNDDSSDDSDDDSTEKHQKKARQNNFVSKQTKSKTNNYQPQKQYGMFERQKKTQIIQGVFLTKTQLDAILEKHAPPLNQSINHKNDNKNEEKFNELRKKYTDLCHLLQKQKAEHEQQMEKQKQQFEVFKANQIQKIKNQKRVMERQLKSTMPSQSHNTQKDRQQVENLKKQLQKQKDEQKKKDKNNRILIQKYKKQNQDLKLRIDKLQADFQKAQTMALNNQSSFGNLTNSQKNLSRHTNDKSQSKINTNKDASPLKSKNNSKLNKTQQNEEQQENKNFKKTVPIRSTKQTSKHTKNNSSVSMKKDKSFDSYQKDDSDQNLPTFKVSSNKNQFHQMKPNQKKYQYVQNTSQQQNNYSNKNNSKSFTNKTSGKNIIQNKKKNVFSNKFDSSSSQDQNENQQQRSDDNESQNESQSQGFFKNTLKFNKLSDLITNKFSIKDVTPEIITKLFRYQNNEQYKKYIQRIQNPRRVIVNSSQNGVDKKTTNIYNDKSKQMLFQNGVKKVIFQTGYLIIYFKNGDIKQTLSDGTILYYFKEKQVDQITLTNGINIYRFDNNQVELHFDGGKYIEIRHPDGTIKVLGSPVH